MAEADHPDLDNRAFGRSVCGNFAQAGVREWLVTNGIGGYASGTIAGHLARRYHGLLIAALKPPLGRTLLVSKYDETIGYDGRNYEVYANHWAGGVGEPFGFHRLESFCLDGTVPVWTYALADALLEKRVWMQQGANTTYVRYRLLRGSAPLLLSAKILINYRDHHAGTKADGWRMEIERLADGLEIVAFDDAVPFRLLSADGVFTPQHDWYRSFFLGRESSRGLGDMEDHLYAGRFEEELEPGRSITLIASTEAFPGLDGDRALAERQERERALVARSAMTGEAPWLRRLVLSADQFIVNRPLPDGSGGRSVIAGYPWFGDWGRDTMIALPGLTLGSGRAEDAAAILRTFARHVDQGMLPNRFPDAGEVPEYNTVDATLWYFEAIRAYVEHSGDRQLLVDLFPVLEQIIDWHLRGTRYGIGADPDDGLLRAGEPGVQLTWMDAKVGDWVVTPRIGKPVEINALWYNALCFMADAARILGQGERNYRHSAKRVAQGFARFWNPERGYLFDVLDGPQGHDAALRPNQLLAVSLRHSPLDSERQRAVVDICAHTLLTSYGLRSLDAGDPAYRGRYRGGPIERDGAYHQGTVWSWLIGPFVAAHLRVYRDAPLARSFLLPFEHHLDEHGLGSIGEIFDGDAPHTPRGATFQAWAVAEVLRAWTLTGSPARNEETSLP